MNLVVFGGGGLRETSNICQNNQTSGRDVNLHFRNKKLAYHPLDEGVRFPHHIYKDSDSTGITAVTLFEYAIATTTLNSSHFIRNLI
jgi:hypothetical protein